LRAARITPPKKGLFKLREIVLGVGSTGPVLIAGVPVEHRKTTTNGRIADQQRERRNSA
jgi:hypothetical protein